MRSLIDRLRDIAWARSSNLEMEAADRIAELERQVEILRAERDHARAMYENATNVLLGIHALLYPSTITTNDGKTYMFKSPHLHEQMQALSDQIRAIPDKLAALAQAKKEGS